LLCQRAAQVAEESVVFPAVTGTASNGVSLTGESEVWVAPGTDVYRFIRQIFQRFIEVERLLEQAEQIGSRIKRRPYSEYIDEIERTGRCRVEAHGFGLFVDGRLIFYPDYKVFFVNKTEQPNTFEIHPLEPKTTIDPRPN